jgi:hypothetical protein
MQTAARKRGSPIAAQTIEAARAARSSKAAKASASTRAAIDDIRRGGISTLGAIGKALELRGILTPAGGSTWQRAQVARVMVAGMVRVVITCDHVYLPLGADGNVITDWQQDCPGPVNADGESPRPDPSKVVRETKLCSKRNCRAAGVQMRFLAMIESPPVAGCSGVAICLPSSIAWSRGVPTGPKGQKRPPRRDRQCRQGDADCHGAGDRNRPSGREESYGCSVGQAGWR